MEPLPAPRPPTQSHPGRTRRSRPADTRTTVTRASSQTHSSQKYNNQYKMKLRFEICIGCFLCCEHHGLKRAAISIRGYQHWSLGSPAPILVHFCLKLNQRAQWYLQVLTAGIIWQDPVPQRGILAQQLQLHCLLPQRCVQAGTVLLRYLPRPTEGAVCGA